jgi:hypothetical protein
LGGFHGSAGTVAQITFRTASLAREALADTGRKSTSLTVKEILDEQLARKLA